MINYIWTMRMRQYVYHMREGHEDQNTWLEESRWPDGWVSVKYGHVAFQQENDIEFRRPNDRSERDQGDEASSAAQRTTKLKAKQAQTAVITKE